MIIFNLDGTLADCEHRMHFVDSGRPHPTKEEAERWMKYFSDRKECPMWEPDWKSFYEACDQDKPIIPTGQLLLLIAHKFSPGEIWVEIWSDRCESTRKKTADWLLKQSAPNDRAWLNHCLKMRPIGDHTPDDELKERWLDEALANGKNIDFVFDDRPKAIRMWRRRGIFVFNCCQHDEEF